MFLEIALSNNNLKKIVVKIDIDICGTIYFVITIFVKRKTYKEQFTLYIKIPCRVLV